jgi:hypothetical protein
VSEPTLMPTVSGPWSAWWKRH